MVGVLAVGLALVITACFEGGSGSAPTEIPAAADFCEEIYQGMEDLDFTEPVLPEELRNEIGSLLQSTEIQNRDIRSCEGVFLDHEGNAVDVAWTIISGSDYRETRIESGHASGVVYGAAGAFSFCDDASTGVEDLAGDPVYFEDVAASVEEDNESLLPRVARSIPFGAELLAAASSARGEGAHLCDSVAAYPNPIPTEWQSDLGATYADEARGIYNCRICGDEFTIVTDLFVASVSDMGDQMTPEIEVASALALLDALNPLISQMPAGSSNLGEEEDGEVAATIADAASSPAPSKPQVSPTWHCVTNVAPDDTLNLRRGPGVDEEVTYRIPPLACDIYPTGPQTAVAGSIWVEVDVYDHLAHHQGWVNSSYIEERDNPCYFDVSQCGL